MAPALRIFSRTPVCAAAGAVNAHSSTIAVILPLVMVRPLVSQWLGCRVLNCRSAIHSNDVIVTRSGAHPRASNAARIVIRWRHHRFLPAGGSHERQTG